MNYTHVHVHVQCTYTVYDNKKSPYTCSTVFTLHVHVHVVLMFAYCIVITISLCGVELTCTAITVKTTVEVLMCIMWKSNY